MLSVCYSGIFPVLQTYSENNACPMLPLLNFCYSGQLYLSKIFLKINPPHPPLPPAFMNHILLFAVCLSVLTQSWSRSVRASRLPNVMVTLSRHDHGRFRCIPSPKEDCNYFGIIFHGLLNCLLHLFHYITQPCQPGTGAIHCTYLMFCEVSAFPHIGYTNF